MKTALIFIITFISSCSFAQAKWWPKEIDIHVPAISHPSMDTIDLRFNAPAYTFEGSYRKSSEQIFDSVNILLYPITISFLLDTANKLLNNFKFQLAVDINYGGNYHDTVYNLFLFDHLNYIILGDKLFVDDSSILCMDELNSAYIYQYSYITGESSEAFSFKSKADSTKYKCKLILALEKPINAIFSVSDYLISPIEIYPNPSTGLTYAFCRVKKSSSIHLHIFNELGKDIMTIQDGILSEGSHNFSFQLPQGMYYVRMETEEGVVTKKVVVE